MTLTEEEDTKLLAIRIRVNKNTANHAGMCNNKDFVNHANGAWIKRWFKDFDIMLSKEESAFMTRVIMELNQ